MRGEKCVLFFTLKINFPVPARVYTSACLVLASLKFLLLRNTDLLPTTPYFACTSCLYLFKGFQNKHQWLLLNKGGCPCLNVEDVCFLMHVLIFIEFLPYQLPSLQVFFKFFFGSSLHTLAVYLSFVSYSRTSASDSVLSEKSREAQDSYIVWCVGIVPFWFCFRGFEGKKKTR